MSKSIPTSAWFRLIATFLTVFAEMHESAPEITSVGPSPSDKKQPEKLPNSVLSEQKVEPGITGSV
jgi:hypothetical protein